MAVDVKRRILFLDGQKSIALEQYPDSAWTYLMGGPDEVKKGVKDFFAVVPWLRRGVDLRANAVSSMPFALVDKKGEDYDNSTDWQNKCGFLPNPSRLLSLVEASLALANRAYLFREQARLTTTGLRYIIPTGVTPKLDPLRGLIGFTRPVNGVPKPFEVEQFVYFWRPDPYVEIGPSDNSPARAAAMAAGVLTSVDTFAEMFFQRGAIKATILSIQGTVNQAERNRLKEWWQSMLSGLSNAWKAEVVNADAVKATQVGDGVESLHELTLTREKREDIAAALGIPQTLLFSDASTNATAGLDQMAFLQHTVVPECGFIAEVFNEQVFEPLELRMEFRPETLDAFQEDENNRSASLLNLVNSGMDLLLAMDVLGFELTEKQRAQLEPQPEPIPEPQPAPDMQPNEAAAYEMRTWHRFAKGRLGKPSRAFVCRTVPMDVQMRVTGRVAKAQTPEELAAIFDEEIKLLPAFKANGREYLADLAVALREATKALSAPAIEPALAGLAIKADNMTVHQVQPEIRNEITVPAPDMKPVSDALRDGLAGVRKALGETPQPMSPAPPDMTPVVAAIDRLAAGMRGLFPGKLKGKKIVRRGKDGLIQSVDEETELS